MAIAPQHRGECVCSIDVCVWGCRGRAEGALNYPWRRWRSGRGRRGERPPPSPNRRGCAVFCNRLIGRTADDACVLDSCPPKNDRRTCVFAYLKAGATSILGRLMTSVCAGSVPASTGHTVRARPKSVPCQSQRPRAVRSISSNGIRGGDVAAVCVCVCVCTHAYVDACMFESTYREHVPPVRGPQSGGQAADDALGDGALPRGVADAEELQVVCVVCIIGCLHAGVD